MKISLVAAVAENGVIGREGGLPWRLPADLAHLKRLTTGHCIVMGRRTFESIGRALPDRTTIVVTRDAGFRAKDVVVAQSVDAALAEARARGETETFVLGGESVYAATLPRADRLHLTRVHAEVEGDTRFPGLDEALAGGAWTLVREEPHPADARHAHAFTVQLWERSPEHRSGRARGAKAE